MKIPEGWKLVPIRPTDEMVEALIDTPWLVECKTRLIGNKAITENAEARDQRYIVDGWEAMVKAAPEPPEDSPAEGNRTPCPECGGKLMVPVTGDRMIGLRPCSRCPQPLTQNAVEDSPTK
jgi:hypothetical protein